MPTIYTLKKRLADIKTEVDKASPETEQEFSIGSIDEPDDFEPGTEVFIIGGTQGGYYRLDEHGKKHLIRRG